MDVLKILENNINFFIANPVPFIAVFVVTFGGIWAYAKHYYNGRIEDLKEKILLRDDQIKYYKELSETKQPPSISVTDNIASHPPVNNLKEDIRRELQFLKQHAGKAISMQLFERLQPKYDFTVILSEIILMNKNNELKWDGSPNPPEALSEMSILK